ncbi:HPr family phosphocarrier protein [Ahrensia sp. R2A130]|uniref:HPr family phosphocarrier protein n=1 Tax=Ahrensia sp. R2A130 TaxID=744979 RepID=UPI0001E0B4AE|nr:HPr family phosphocarrier protein [Ahrensia sp. R2A130]EFL89739.1 phosphocarrier protein HPr [Ahrensia sp. R2A130]
MTAGERQQFFDAPEIGPRRFDICNVRGLHARASAKFVKTAEQFDALVHVSKDGQTVEATSIMGLMMLAASPGCCIDVTARGPQAEAALDALDALVADKFGEGE